MLESIDSTMVSPKVSLSRLGEIESLALARICFSSCGGRAGAN